MRSTRGPDKASVVGAALREHRPSLKAFVRARVPPEEVEDVLQMAATRAVERAETLDDSDRVLPWLFRVHRNIVIDETRKRARQRRLIDDVAVVLEQHDETEAICRCSSAQVKNLPPSYASILALVDMGDLTLTEAAHTLGLSHNNATVRLHRARKALKKQMLDHCGVTSLRDCFDCRCVHDGCCAT